MCSKRDEMQSLKSFDANYQIVIENNEENRNPKRDAWTKDFQKQDKSFS
jgi:hypothetical protein